MSPDEVAALLADEAKYHWRCRLCGAAYNCRFGDLPIDEPGIDDRSAHRHDWRKV